MNEIKARRMETGDVEQVYSSGIKVEEFEVSLEEAKESPFWPKNVLYEWVKSDDVLLVAEDGEKIVGYILTRLHQPTGKADIENIFVDENYRKQGIASMLLSECLKQLKSKGARYVCVLTKTNNKSTIEFLKKNNFNKGYEFVWMDKFL